MYLHQFTQLTYGKHQTSNHEIFQIEPTMCNRRLGSYYCMLNFCKFICRSSVLTYKAICVYQADHNYDEISGYLLLCETGDLTTIVISSSLSRLELFRFEALGTRRFLP